jgi:DNA-binding NarL/FixJ family response regulator
MSSSALTANRAECPTADSIANDAAIRRSIQRIYPSIRVVLVDPAELMHLAVRALLAEDARYSRPVATTTVCLAEKLLRQVRPELVICEIDIADKSGIAFCRWALNASPLTRVVILTSRNEPLLATAALAAGAAGYLLKDSPHDLLRASLEQVAAGHTIVDDRLGGPGQTMRQVDAVDHLGLSRREREVLGELIAGQDNKSIAAILNISEDTVKTHLKSIFRKLGARDRAHALALVIGTATATSPGMMPSRRVASGPAARSFAR